MRDEETLRPGGFEGFDGLVQREVSSRLAVELTAQQRRLADEQVGVAGGFDQLLRRRGISRVGERALVGLDPEGVRLERVVGNAGRSDRRAARPGTACPAGTRSARRFARTCPGNPRRSPSPVRNSAPPGCTHSCGLREGAVRREIEGAPDPRDEISPVVEVEVRDRDPVDSRPELRSRAAGRAHPARSRAAARVPFASSM